ncbi:MAG: glycosyltransferase family 2 protein [bacterium]
MPAFNEAPTIIGVLDDLVARVDRLVIVNDGSADQTGALVDAWVADREGCSVIHFPENRGLSAALRAGWDYVRELLAAGDVSPDDVAFSIDADGQHEPSAVDGMIDHLVANNLDCVIGQRDLGYHTGYKKFGNHVMTVIGRWSGGFRFDDVESGYRVFRIGPLLDAQQYYEGYKYSETVEVAVILCRLGYRMCNSYGIAIPVARTRTRLIDAAIDAVCMPMSWYRLSLYRRFPRRSPLRTAASHAPLVLLPVAAAVALVGLVGAAVARLH